MIQVKFLNHQGGGYAVAVTLDDGATTADCFAKAMPDSDASQFLVRVNRKPALSTDKLAEDDTVVVLPNKMGGA
jgi:hypothetical protein